MRYTYTFNYPVCPCHLCRQTYGKAAAGGASALGVGHHYPRFKYCISADRRCEYPHNCRRNADTIAGVL